MSSEKSLELHKICMSMSSDKSSQLYKLCVSIGEQTNSNKGSQMQEV